MAPVPPRDDSSNRSMDQEVIMEEVKRQVQLAMQGRDSELSSLKMENNELSKALDASAQLLNDVVQMGGDGQGRSSQEPEQEFSRRELEGNPAGGAADRKEPTGAPPGLQRVLRLPGGNPRGEGRGEPSFTEFPRGPTGRGDSAGGKPGLRMEDTTRPEHLGPSSGDPLQRATEFGGDELSLLDVLVQGMKQLQQVYMDKKNPESETVKGSTELPQLPDLSGDTGVEFSDWMYVAEQIIGSIGSLSDSSTAWFSSTLSCAKEAYERHQQATPMERLTISPVLPPELASSKWSRLERRVMTMMLTAMPQAVKEDAVTHRVATVASIVYRLHVLYAPGGAAERAALLKQLEGVSAGENVSDVIAALRKWRRNLTRTMEMGVTPPDSSVLLRGIELILGTALKKLPDVSFRFNMEQMIHPDYVQLKLRQAECPVKDPSKGKSGAGAATASSTSAPLASMVATASAAEPKAITPEALQNPEIQNFMKEVNTMLQRMSALRAMRVKVTLADGNQVTLQQNKAGTLMPAKGSVLSGENAVTTTIVPLVSLVQELGCSISWDRRGLKVQHPEHGEITTHVSGSCPFIGETKALELINELETRKLEQLKVKTLEAQLKMRGIEATTSFEVQLQEYRRTGRRADGLKALMCEDSVFGNLTEVQRCSLIQEVDLSDKAGHKYLKALPVKRVLEEDGVTLLEVDVNISKSYNLREPAPVYRALLWAAMRGQVHGVLGGPPRGEGTGDLVLKQMFVWMIAAQAAESYEIAAPGFAMCMPTRSDLWESSVWKSFQSSYNVNLIKGKPEVSLVTTLSFSATDVLWERMMGPLKEMSKEELAKWIQHVRDGHVPFHRRCQTCVAARAKGHAHRRIEAPSCHTMSLDVCGPFRVRGHTPEAMDQKYMLVASYVIPKLKASNGGPEDEIVNEPEGGVGYVEPPADPVADADSNGVLPGGPVAHADSDGVLPGGPVADADSDGVLPGGPDLEDLFAEEEGGRDEPLGDVDQAEWDRANQEYNELISEVGDRLDYQVLRFAVPAERGVLVTTGEAQSPQQNGRAEATVQFVKSEAKCLLTAAKLGKENWPLAMRYATYRQRVRTLGKTENLPQFGCPVFVRTKIYGRAERYDMENKWKQGVYVGPSDDVAHGHVVKFEDNTFVTTQHMRTDLVDTDALVELEPREIELPLPERRMREKTRLALLSAEPPLNLEEEKAEEYARTLCRNREYGIPGILQLFALLKNIKTKRRLCQDHEFSAVGLLENVGMGCHKDSHNNAATKNALVMLKKPDTGGELWLEADDPHHDEVEQKQVTTRMTRLGELHDLEVGVPLYFNPRRWHEVKPWQGDRVGMVLYSPRATHLHYKDQEKLEFIGFPAGALDGHSEGIPFEEGCESDQPGEPELHLLQPLPIDGGGTLDDALLTLSEDQEQLIEDIERKSVRLRLLLEEEEALAEECRRAGRIAADEADNGRGILEDMIADLAKYKAKVRDEQQRQCLRAAFATQDDIDYESLLDNLQGDLEVVHTVPLDQVRAALPRWMGAIEKENKQLLDGTLREIKLVVVSVWSYVGTSLPETLYYERASLGSPKTALRATRIPCHLESTPDEAVGVSPYTLEQSNIFKPSEADPDLWLVYDEEDRERSEDTLLGLVVTYVDDLLYLAPTTVVTAIHSWIGIEWPCSQLEWASDPKGTRYLGMEIQQRENYQFEISQEGYIKELLRNHNMEDAVGSRLPCPKEWLNEGEGDGDDENYSSEELKFAQRVVGEQLWLTMRSRPDLQFPVGFMAARVSRQPARVAQIARKLLAYLKTTREMKLVLGPTADDDGKKEVFMIGYSDASFSPYGEKSFGASVVTVMNTPIAWKAAKQGFVTLSVMEAELYEATNAVLLMESVGSVLDEVLGSRARRLLRLDNSSALAMIQGGPGSWRTRHLKVRSSKIRDQVDSGELSVEHVTGDRQLADLSTKMHPKMRLWELLTLWGFKDLPGEAVEALEAKNAYLALLVMARLVCPAEAEEDQTARSGLKSVGVDELFLVTVLVCITAVAMWEAGKWIARCVLRYCKESPKQRRLRRLRETARTAAEEEIDRAFIKKDEESDEERTAARTARVVDDVPEPHPVARPRSTKRIVDTATEVAQTREEFELLPEKSYYKTNSTRSKLHTDPHCHGLRNSGDVYAVEYCTYCQRQTPLYTRRSRSLQPTRSF
ncbi:Copia protein [Symbiodinium microadriaticum]|uniref:Copia protein n=1 Tax=Symbiodinium microadriaticum TaxID=2951 RepID=A0A1Q9D9K8_SYMMI|nr:Copia protein [Symbiodinium microadriaticum]